MERKKLDIDRLRAAYEAGGYSSWQQLASAAGITHPTLSRLRSGRVRAANAATLERLAKALSVPREWLTGEREDLPYVPQWGPVGRGKGQSLWEWPTAAAVRDSWFMQRVEAALRRDLAEWYGPSAGAAYDSWAHGLLTVFYELSSSIVWRSACLVRSPGGSGQALLESDDLPTLDWLTHILEPWFAARAYLNAPVLRGLFTSLVANPDRLWGSDIRDADALRALEQYELVCHQAESERLASVLGPEEDEGTKGT